MTGFFIDGLLIFGLETCHTGYKLKPKTSIKA